MQDAILKTQWEKSKTPFPVDTSLAKELISPLIHDEIEKIQLMPAGSANANYKITFKSTLPPVILRIYMREEADLAREVALHQFIANKIPVPRHLDYHEKSELIPYPYAIMEYISGTLMRDIILTQNETDISILAFEAGKYLSLLREMHLPVCGFFQPDLSIKPFDPNEEYLTFLTAILEKENVKKSIGSTLQAALHQLLSHHAELLPSISEANLTHSDFDPANILVKKIHGHFKITAILDWEFAFAGSYLIDIGTMLRYSHKLPSYYENNFIEGIENFTQPLNKDWKKQAKLIDLLSLLQLIDRHPSTKSPKLNKDVIELISHTVAFFKT